jgi:hypothetical protein
MNDPLKGSYKGRDIIINFDTKEVTIRRVSGCRLFSEREEWITYPLVTITVSSSENLIIVNLYRRSISDLSLTPESIAKGLGIARNDGERNKEIWESQQTIKGEDIAIDFFRDEVTLWRSSVLPFSGIYCVVNSSPAYILEKYPYVNGLLEEKWWKHSIAGLPMEAEELANKFGVPLLDADDKRDERWFIKHLIEAVGEDYLRRILTVMASGVELQGKVNGRYFDGGGVSVNSTEIVKIERMGYVYRTNKGIDGTYLITEKGRSFLTN